VTGAAVAHDAASSASSILSGASGACLRVVGGVRSRVPQILERHELRWPSRPAPDAGATASGDLLPPDLETVFYGHDGYRQLWRYWLDAFEDIRWDPEEILDFGDKFLVTTQQRGRGSGSGVAVSEPVFQLFTVRRGLVVRQEDFLDRSKALEAVGLRE
jgi:ketosteroid isomerase-like protein